MLIGYHSLPPDGDHAQASRHGAQDQTTYKDLSGSRFDVFGDGLSQAEKIQNCEDGGTEFVGVSERTGGRVVSLGGKDIIQIAEGILLGSLSWASRRRKSNHGVCSLSTVLDEIVAHKRQEVRLTQEQLPFAELEQQLALAPAVRSFLTALKGAVQPGLIAEVKKASPSAGIIREDFSPVEIATTYEASGASCLSVLTDEKYFQGHLDFLKQIRPAVKIPVMRKEFIIDRYQVLEARVAGADCVLLIAECLTDEELQDLHDYAHQLGMDTLIELYEPSNLPRALNTGGKLIGINNRDLRTFQTSLEHTFELMQTVPEDVLLVSESGIRTHADIQRLRESGVGAVLVGESLMRCPDIGVAVRELMIG